jgi:hypothetical protein
VTPSQASIIFSRELEKARREGYLLAVAEVERHIGGGLDELHAWIKTTLDNAKP